MINALVKMTVTSEDNPGINYTFSFRPVELDSLCKTSLSNFLVGFDALNKALISLGSGTGGYTCIFNDLHQGIIEVSVENDDEKSDIHIEYLDEWEGVSKLSPSTIYLVEVR